MSKFVDPTGHATFGVAICARCSRKFPLDELYDDPNAVGLKVCKDDLDDYDPYRLAARVGEDVALPFTRPDEPINELTGDPTHASTYVRALEDGGLRATESGLLRIIEQAPSGGTPPWET